MTSSDKLGRALLVMDIQGATMDSYDQREPLLDALSSAIAKARAAGIPVFFVVFAFREGYPEINPDNRMFSRLLGREGLEPGDSGARVHPRLAPLPGDILVVKKRVSAFSGSDLEILLRVGGIRHLVLGGFSTSGVVLSTLREAADKDYDLTVLSDGCADRDPEVHHLLMTKVFPRQAEVLSVEQWRP